MVFFVYGVCLIDVVASINDVGDVKLLSEGLSLLRWGGIHLNRLLVYGCKVLVKMLLISHIEGLVVQVLLFILLK
jgi:hypothetical protein